MLLTYTDVLVLRQFRPPEEVAHYYAAAKTLALVTFIHFSVSAAVAHRFAAHHVAGDRDGAGDASPPARCAGRSGRRSLTIAVILALGKPILWLFGPSFDDGYPLMFILAIALIARAAVGPAERVLNMLGEQRRLRAGLCRDVRAEPGRMRCGGRALRQHRRRLRDRGEPASSNRRCCS